LRPQIFVGVAHRILCQPFLEFVQVQAQVLNLPLAELDVVVAQRVADRPLVFTSEMQHRLVEVYADDSPGPSDLLCTDVADLPSAGAQVQNHLSLADPPARIAATVVTLDDFLGQRLQILRVVSIGGNAEAGLRLPRCRGISLAHGRFNLDRCDCSLAYAPADVPAHRLPVHAQFPRDPSTGPPTIV
jgi:hypothetical protein